VTQKWPILNHANKLALQAGETGRLDQPSYRTGAAYAVQDLEKYTEGKPISMPPELRAELSALAATSPGLQDKRMQALVAKTSELTDRDLILVTAQPGVHTVCPLSVALIA